MSSILLSNEFQTENLSFSEPKKNSMGGNNVLINYEINGRPSPIIIQTPRLRVPFGIDKQEPEGGGASRFYVNLSLNNTGATGKFFDVIKSIEQVVKNTAVEQSEQWFGKKKTLEVVEELMRSTIKYPKDTKYDPTLKIKLPFNNNGPTYTLYDESKEKIKIYLDGELDLSCIEKGCDLTCIIQCTGVYFIGKSQFGIGWRLLQAKVHRANKLSGYSIVDKDDELEQLYEDY